MANFVVNLIINYGLLPTLEFVSVVSSIPKKDKNNIIPNRIELFQPSKNVTNSSSDPNYPIELKNKLNFSKFYSLRLINVYVKRFDIRFKEHIFIRTPFIYLCVSWVLFYVYGWFSLYFCYFFTFCFVLYLPFVLPKYKNEEPTHLFVVSKKDCNTIAYGRYFQTIRNDVFITRNQIETYKYDVVVFFLEKFIELNQKMGINSMLGFEKMKKILSKPNELEILEEFVQDIPIESIIEKARISVTKINEITDKEEKERRDAEKFNQKGSVYGRLDFLLEVVFLKVLKSISNGDLESSLLFCNKVWEFFGLLIVQQKANVKVIKADLINIMKLEKKTATQNLNPRILFIRGLVNELCCELEKAYKDYAMFLEMFQKMNYYVIQWKNEMNYLAVIANIRIIILSESIKSQNYQKHIKEFKIEEFNKYLTSITYKMSLNIAIKKENEINNVKTKEVVILKEVDFGERNMSKKDEDEYFTKSLSEKLKNCSFYDFNFIKRIGKKKLISSKKNFFGCNSDIYLCEHRELKQLLVMKIIRNFFNEENVIEGILENEVTKMKYNRNIISILKSKKEKIDYSVLPDSSQSVYNLKNVTVFFVMNYYELNLATYIQKRRKNKKKITRKEFLEMAFQMISAINYIKKNNYVHRDIKPENIFIDHEYGKLVIGDFGECLKVKNSFMKKNNYIMKYKVGDSIGGSLYYLPVEVTNLDFTKENLIDYSKSDIFSVGLCLYYILSDKAPFGEVNSEDRKQSDYIRLECDFNIFDDISDFIGLLLIVDHQKRLSGKQALEMVKRFKKKVKFE